MEPHAILLIDELAEKRSADQDLLKVRNYVAALEYGIRRLESLPLSLRLTRELHERLMTGVRGDKATPGEFRKSQNWIGPAGSTPVTAAYVPPPVNDVNRSYLPGSPERAELKSRLAQMASEKIDIPIVIGGREIRTGRTEKTVMPHDHRHVAGSGRRGR